MDYAFIGNLEQQKCKQYAIHENIKKYQKCNTHEYNRILVTFRFFNCIHEISICRNIHSPTITNVNPITAYCLLKIYVFYYIYSLSLIYSQFCDPNTSR